MIHTINYDYSFREFVTSRFADEFFDSDVLFNGKYGIDLTYGDYDDLVRFYVKNGRNKVTKMLLSNDQAHELDAALTINFGSESYIEFSSANNAYFKYILNEEEDTWVKDNMESREDF